jgi:hypothetical protein
VEGGREEEGDGKGKEVRWGWREKVVGRGRTEGRNRMRERCGGSYEAGDNERKERGR